MRHLPKLIALPLAALIGAATGAVIVIAYAIQTAFEDD